MKERNVCVWDGRILCGLIYVRGRKILFFVVYVPSKSVLFIFPRLEQNITSCLQQQQRRQQLCSAF